MAESSIQREAEDPSMEETLPVIVKRNFSIVYFQGMNELRKAHNYLSRVKPDYLPNDLDLVNNYLKETGELPEYKVALVMVSVNPNYWQYAAQVYEDVQKYFLPGHKTDVFLWSDMPKLTQEKLQEKEQALKAIEEKNATITPEERATLIFNALSEYVDALYLWSPKDQQKITIAANSVGLAVEFQPTDNGNSNLIVRNVDEHTVAKIVAATRETLQKYKSLQENSTVTEVEPIEWPYGTLMRYSMFLQQEEALKEYDYIFYLDADMRIVNVVGDEILGQGLTIAPHPGYYLRKELYPPYEPNDQSASFIKRPGKVVMIDGQPRFMPFYAAGGFQGGTAKSYIHAIKETKKLIDKDLNVNNYIPIWNDESAFNKYVFDIQNKKEIEDTIFLTPSYIYPDSLINEYYIKIWGRNYPARIITLTKPFTVQKMDMGKFQTM